MSFNSIDFAIFLPIVFTIYWLSSRSLKLQNLIIVMSSFVFYGWWDWRFLFVMIGTASVDFVCGLALAGREDTRSRRTLLLISIAANLGTLVFFKYFNFFTESFVSAFTLIGVSFSPTVLQITLPIGISFYTFQALSYTIDVYRKKLSPTSDAVAFFAFISFFPQLVAGPIERATHLLPQICRERAFDYSKAVDGLRQILWGLFKKIVIADHCGQYANLIFSDSTTLSGSTLLIGAYCFAFQLYGDFSGYSDVAIGTSRLFGFNLIRNFNFPFFAKSIPDFWSRWHISLTTWFRDYLYLPLSRRHRGTSMMAMNIFVVFLVSGLWHGAQWTFVIWGLINAIFYLPFVLKSGIRPDPSASDHSFLPSLRTLFSMLATFNVLVLALVFFRAETAGHAIDYLGRIFSISLFSVPTLPYQPTSMPTSPIVMISLILIFILVEWNGRTQEYAIERLALNRPALVRYVAYYALILVIFWHSGKTQQYIYFQF